MGKGSIIWEVNKAFQDLKAFGQSKLAERKHIAHETGKRLRDVESPKIHAIETWRTYLRWSLSCAEWCRSTLGVRHLRDLKPEHAAAYLQHLTEKNYSVWSLKTVRSALAKLLGVSGPSIADVGVRHLANIKRSRHPVAMDKDFSKNGKYKSYVDFGEATGLRNCELPRIRVKDIEVTKEGIVMVHLDKGKGGQPRDIEVLRGREQAVLKARDDAIKRGGKDDTRIFDWVPRKIKYDEHAARAAYAWRMYKQHERLDRPRKDLLVRRNGEIYDKIALLKVAEYLGHHRISVMIKHYSWNRQ
ncbi:MAG: hypothetical protein ACM3WU_04235 [Bacillota bacterium]